MKKLAKVLLVAVLLVACVFTMAVAAESGDAAEASPSKMFATFWALVPPIIAIGLALITKEVYSSLFIGVLCGALFYSNFNVVQTVDTMLNQGLIESVSGTAGIFIFLVLLGVLVALI
ncbi:MAG: Na+/H+ antiporter NhaC family protein, partial [Clostridia bacterium]|nr:Na+/H+ antiporter NhaC family protein [Clostridia bacterium]